MQSCGRILANAVVPVAADCICVQTRQYKAVVMNNNVTKAMRLLNTHVKEEKLTDKWRAAKLYTKPSHQRVIQEKETQKKLNRQKFKSMMYWVMQAKSRFATLLVHVFDLSYEPTTAGRYSHIDMEICRVIENSGDISDGTNILSW